MLIEQIIEVESRCLVSRLYIFLKLVNLMTKQKSSKANLQVNDLMLKMLQKAMYLDSPDQAKSQNLTPKWKCFKRVLDLTWSKGRNLFDWLSNLKNFVLSNGSENVRNEIQMAFKKPFFSENLQTIAQRLDALLPDSHSLRRWWLRPQAPFELH